MNATDIAAALSYRAEELWRRYLPDGKRQGNYWTIGNLDGDKGRCCSSLCPVGPPRYLTGLLRRRIAWDDGTIREASGAGDVAFAMNRCC